MSVLHYYTTAELQLYFDDLDKAFDAIIPILAQHFEKGSTTLSASTIHRLAESSAHYLVCRWPSRERHGSHTLLPILLARLVTTYYETAPDIACAAAVTLAAAAFACGAYPGGEGPTPDSFARQKRALSMLRYYQTHKPNQDKVTTLFYFGLCGVLPRCIVDGRDTQLAALVSSFNDMRMSRRIRRYAGIWSLPPSFSLWGHTSTCLFECFSSGAQPINDETAQILVGWLIATWDQFRNSARAVSPRIYTNALIALCFAKSKEHQELFVGAIDAQRVPDTPLKQLNSNDDNSPLWHLCHSLLNTRTPMFPVAAVHFGLLVASIISSTEGSLDDRRPFVFEELVSHLEQCTNQGSTFNSLGRTMQFVVDFCAVDWSPNMGSGPGSAGGTNEVDWHGKLQELKDRYRPNIDGEGPSIAEIGYIDSEGPGIEETGYPPGEVAAGVTAATSGTVLDAAGTEQNWYYPSDPEWCC
ncbi:hypothetical protein FRC10_006272 [Ceratobasidium sp. 414]|nr:hypothetical protein FRC10_006272 [Ceratobasidium sp. 414]